MKKNNKDSKNSEEVENNKEEQNPKPKDKEQESSNLDDQDIKSKDAEDKLNDDQSSENNDENSALREEKIRILAEMERDKARGDVSPPENFDFENPQTSWRSHRNLLFQQWLWFCYQRVSLVNN